MGHDLTAKRNLQERLKEQRKLIVFTMIVACITTYIIMATNGYNLWVNATGSHANYYQWMMFSL